MSDQDNPFKTNPVTPPASDVNPADQLLASIKNEQGEQKYKSVEDALKALANSQAFIPKLIDEKKIVEQELQSLREKASKIDSIEEVVRKLTENQQPPKVETPPASGVSADQVAELVKKQLEQVALQTQAQKNFSDVQNALKQKFGDKTREEVAKKAAELGTTPDKLGELASQSPAMVLALFNSQKSTVAPTPAGSFNLPPVPKPLTVERPAKSVLLGATSRDQKAHLLDHKKAVYEKFNVTV